MLRTHTHISVLSWHLVALGRSRATITYKESPLNHTFNQTLPTGKIKCHFCRGTLKIYSLHTYFRWLLERLMTLSVSLSLFQLQLRLRLLYVMTAIHSLCYNFRVPDKTLGFKVCYVEWTLNCPNKEYCEHSSGSVCNTLTKCPTTKPYSASNELNTKIDSLHPVK